MHPHPANLVQPFPPLAPLKCTIETNVLRKLVGVGEDYMECTDRMAALILRIGDRVGALTRLKVVIFPDVAALPSDGDAGHLTFR